MYSRPYYYLGAGPPPFPINTIWSKLLFHFIQIEYAKYFIKRKSNLFRKILSKNVEKILRDDSGKVSKEEFDFRKIFI